MVAIELTDEIISQIEKYREDKTEDYNTIINRILVIAKTLKENLELSKETVVAIEKAREEIKNGEFDNPDRKVKTKKKNTKK